MNDHHHNAWTSKDRRAFTLIELLVVISIVVILIALLLPALALGRKSGKATSCLANLRGIGQGFILYNGDHRELVVPSYNMTGTTGAGIPLDGWGPLLDRDGYVQGAGQQNLRLSPFCCPEAKDVDGLLAGQTGNDPDNPKGWMDWPCMRSGSGFQTVTIPDQNLEKTVRVAYWINALNPIGGTVVVEPDLHYTGSVGYGPGSNGLFVNYSKTTQFLFPDRLVAAADGVYVGRQRDNRIGTANSRIGYRHPGVTGTANSVFADGHVAPIDGKKFPRALGGKNNPEEVREENRHGEPTVYANPIRALGL